MQTKSESNNNASKVAIFGKITDDDVLSRLILPYTWLFRESTSVEGLLTLIYVDNQKELHAQRFGLTTEGWIHMNTPVPAKIKSTEKNAALHKDQLLDAALEWISENAHVTLEKEDFIQPKVIKEQSKTKIYGQYTADEIIKGNKLGCYS